MRKLAAAVVLAVLCALGMTGAALATPSTLIWIPSTDIQAADAAHLGVDIYIAKEGHPLMDYGLTFGTGKFEYGVDYFHTPGGVASPMRLNAKYLIADEAKGRPRLTVGIYDVGGTAASNIGYVLVSKTFPIARVTLGYGMGKEATLGEDNKMVFAGLDKQLNSKFWAAVDYQGGKSAFGALNVGVAYSFTKNTSLIVGYDWYNNSDIADTTTLQLDINF